MPTTTSLLAFLAQGLREAASFNSLLSGRGEPGKITVCSCDATGGSIAASFTSIGRWSNACERLAVLVSERSPHWVNCPRWTKRSKGVGRKFGLSLPVEDQTNQRASRLKFMQSMSSHFEGI